MYHIDITGPFIFSVMFLLGIIAESMTGVISSSRRNMDAFGVVAIALTTALGGGVVRDVLLGNLPVTIILHPHYIVICLFFSIIAIFTQKYINKFYKIFLILDSIGLIAFAYIGSSIAHQICTQVFHMQFLSVLIVGIVIAILNGVAGGVMRDMICNDIPVAFKADIICICRSNSWCNEYYFYIFRYKFIHKRDTNNRNWFNSKDYVNNL